MTEAHSEVAGPWGVRVCRVQCSTCIFLPGNKMSLNRGRVKGMLRECEKNEGHVTCHETMWDEEDEGAVPAICKGFAETSSAVRSLALRFGHALNMIVEVDPPPADR